MVKKNMFEKGGELGVKVLKAVYVDTTKWGYRQGRGGVS